jgi:hypothetical protein
MMVEELRCLGIRVRQLLDGTVQFLDNRFHVFDWGCQWWPSRKFQETFYS